MFNIKAYIRCNNAQSAQEIIKEKEKFKKNLGEKLEIRVLEGFFT